jgi:hypothetical protein
VGEDLAMNLLHPTLGDMIDRAIILRFKVTGTIGFAEELTELDSVIAPRFTHAVSQLALRLKGIHRLIWVANNELADLAKHPNPPPTDHGLCMWHLNQNRIALIEEIDRLSGEFVRPEKLYR